MRLSLSIVGFLVCKRQRQEHLTLPTLPTNKIMSA